MLLKLQSCQPKAEKPSFLQVKELLEEEKESVVAKTPIAELKLFTQLHK